MSIRNKVIQVSDFYEDREENLSTRQRRVDKDLGFNENSLISDLVVDPRKEKAIQANSYVARRVIMKFSLVVSSTDKENYPVLAETGFQSASRNELHSLELLGA